MLKVGLTGNIGSGKSLVASIFTSLGIPVYHADEESKKFLDTRQVISSLVSLFGLQIVTNEKIDKRKLAEIVFGDEKANGTDVFNNVVEDLAVALARIQNLNAVHRNHRHRLRRGGQSSGWYW